MPCTGSKESLWKLGPGWLGSKVQFVRTQQLGWEGHQCSCDLHSDLHWGPPWATHPHITSLYSLTSCKVGILTHSTKGQASASGATPSPGSHSWLGTEIWLESTNPTHEAGLCPLEGTHGSSGRSRPRNYAKNQRGRIKKRIPGSKKLPLKPRACFSMTLGRPGFSSGSVFCSVK